MPVDLESALRFEAWRQQRAVRSYSHRRIRLQPHAVFAAFLQFPGEDNTILAAALGNRGQRTPTRLLTTPDPRVRDEEAAMIEQLDAYLQRYYGWCERTGVAPQMIVASRGALKHLTNIADDLRFTRHQPQVAAFATRLSHLTMRAQVPDQQALVVLTDVLRTHWVTPMDPTQEHHLGAMLAAVAPPDGVTLAEAVRAAEALTVGPVTLPAFDRAVLQPALARFHTARRRGEALERLLPLRRVIEEATSPLVLRTYEALHQGVELLDAAGLDELPEVESWIDAERTAFLDFRRAEVAGIRTPRQDRARGGAFRYVEREQALAVVEASIECHDTFGRACSVARGAVVEGRVTDVRLVAVPDQRTRATFVTIETTQAALRIREGHELADPVDPRRRYTLRTTERAGPSTAPVTTLTLRMTGGSKTPGPPAIGSAVALVREVPDLHRLGRLRGSLKAKLAREHWVLCDPAPIPTPPGRAIGLPHDLPVRPRLALEVLR